MKQHRLPFTTAILTGTLILTGCTAEASLKALDRTPSAEDQLPDGIRIWPENVVSTGDARLLTTHKGIKYFAAMSSDSKTACIAAVPENQAPESWLGGCGSTVVLDTSSRSLDQTAQVSCSSLTEMLRARSNPAGLKCTKMS
jgi:hypothetical protein